MRRVYGKNSRQRNNTNSAATRYTPTAGLAGSIGAKNIRSIHSTTTFNQEANARKQLETYTPIVLAERSWAFEFGGHKFILPIDSTQTIVLPLSRIGSSEIHNSKTYKYKTRHTNNSVTYENVYVNVGDPSDIIDNATHISFVQTYNNNLYRANNNTHIEITDKYVLRIFTQFRSAGYVATGAVKMFTQVVGSTVAGAYVYVDKDGDGKISEGDLIGVSDENGYTFYPVEGAFVGDTLVTRGGTNSQTGKEVLIIYKTPYGSGVASILTTATIAIQETSAKAGATLTYKQAETLLKAATHIPQTVDTTSFDTNNAGNGDDDLAAVQTSYMMTTTVDAYLASVGSIVESIGSMEAASDAMMGSMAATLGSSGEYGATDFSFSDRS